METFTTEELRFMAVGLDCSACISRELGHSQQANEFSDLASRLRKLADESQALDDDREV